MGKSLLKTDIKREPEKLYYCSTSPDGYIIVCEAMLSRKGKVKSKEKK